MTKKQSVNPAAAAIAGLAVGAAAGAAATALSDKNTRKKLEKKMDQINQQAQEVYGKTSKKIDQAIKTAEPKVRDGIKKLTSDSTGTKQKKRTTRTKEDSLQEKTADQIEELATKGGEVIHQNLPEK